MMVALVVMLQVKAVLDTQRVAARRDVERAGQPTVSVTLTEARERGVSTMSGLLGLVPYLQQRSSRGESGLSVRAARREQVVVTLDGLPLNDPATGIAELSELPLVLLERLAVRPGAAPVIGGSGAVGGLVELTTASRTALSLSIGSFGQRTMEGMWGTGPRARTRRFIAASRRSGRNDFPFLNAAGADPVREQRINNDEQRTALATGWMASRYQLLLLASRAERGMVGAANVRAYDQDRAFTDRVLLRSQAMLGTTMLHSGVRTFHLTYRDPTRPMVDSRSRVTAADLEWRGMGGGGNWLVGGSHDALRATGGVQQERARAFAGWHRDHPLGVRSRLDIGARFDAVQGMQGTPTGNLGITVRTPGDSLAPMWSWHARIARALRVPTLYDLFFNSPQRLTVRALRPERVAVDASVGTRREGRRATTAYMAELSLVHRRTADAIIWFPGNFGWSPANVGRETLIGTEVRASVDALRWSVSGWGTAYDALLHAGAVRIPTPYVARLNGAVLAQWRPHQAWRVNAQWRSQGARPYTAGPRNAAYELPPTQLVDLSISRRITWSREPWLLSVTLDNAINAQWQSVRGFPMPGRAWSVTSTWPAR